ncbi:MULTISPECIES: Spx/MgsR family RNA polymerase-binding regulatory protein [Cohnella]|uniref:Spx/MgsR family RNA polymerase-binding regulatory protein n=1 Tax=Cohnella TaxID=329857 RepID=UPI0009BB0733|nr:MULTISPECIES: Spx/MgsR family RNA polymerase-binding regulatory protein [Cohnella]MBN2979888.1 Spx/MgsR family RNA polymerase-binding regulatory protein [Cohnella algarum]
MSKKLHVYHYPKCGTCRKAVNWLKENGYELELTDIFEQPPSEDELRKLIAQSGLPVAKWFNTSGEVYKEQKLKDKLPNLTDDEKISLLSGNGRLIKRPVMTDGRKATVGFREQDIFPVWGR